MRFRGAGEYRKEHTRFCGIWSRIVAVNLLASELLMTHNTGRFIGGRFWATLCHSGTFFQSNESQ
jgi:hypothetical protein